MTKYIFQFLLISFISFESFAQIGVTNTMSPNQLVQNVLLGFGVTATNITVNGSAVNANTVFSNASYYTAGSTTFPIPSGVLLTTGSGVAAIGPNSSGSFTNNNPATSNVSADPHLNSIANGTVTNGIVLEFDFVPGGDTISFNYIFGSDEYPEFSPSSFNDAFGFFLWGPNPNSPTGLPLPNPQFNDFNALNLAIIPGTITPVTINNVGPGAGQNTAYYVNNLGGAAYGTAIQYDGTTSLLSANASVICGETYHIKLAICNVGDQSYDSGVFLQANSFSSEAIEIAVATVSGDTSVYEGCTEANLMFIRPQTQLEDTLIINYSITGNATMGTDYNALINPITFLPGTDTIVLTVTPIADGIPDNNEYVTITAITVSSCGDTLISSGTLYILDSIPITITETNPTVLCANDSVLVSASAAGLFPPFTYSWTGGQTGTSAFFPSVTGALTGSIDYYVTATNSCGYSNIDTVTVTLNQTLVIDSILVTPATCEPVGVLQVFISGDSTINNVVLYEWSGPGTTNPNTYLASVWENLASGWYYINIEDAVCSINDSVFVDILDPPVAEFSANPTSGCTPLEVTFTNTSQNASSYSWNFGNGQTTNTNNTSPQYQTYTDNTTIRLIANQGNCADTAYLNVAVSICGCTDINATNYNSLATVDDGSCIFPIPTVVAPNVFSPNNDGANPLFYLSTTYSTSIELTILNRWGNVVYEAVGINPVWDGISQNGSDVPEGVYFYKYVIKGYQEFVLEGHGFVHLVR
jgi:gliding motility-associated-like protein